MRSFISNAICMTASIGFTVLAVAASAPSVAATIDQAPSAVVQTADLDLGSAAGRLTAHHRIDAAADRVCGATDGNRLAVATCRSKAVSDATAALDAIGAPQQVAVR